MVTMMAHSAIKKPCPIQRLINWYWGNLEYKYLNCGRGYLNKLNAFGALLLERGITELTHREFAVLVREQLPFRGVKKKNTCEICKRFGIR